LPGVAVATLLVLLAGCGRFGFADPTDATGPGDGDRDGDGDDAAGDDTLDAAGEPCNGIDDNADGRIDEGCACTPFKVTWPQALSVGRPGFAWTGDGYLVLARSSGANAIVPIGPTGAFGTPTNLSAGSVFTVGDTFAWSGTQLGVAYGTSASVELVRYEPAGGGLSAPAIVSASTGSDVHVTWAGDRFGVAWFTGGQALLREVDASGVAISAIETLPTAILELDAMVPTPDGYALGVRTSTGRQMLLVQRAGFTVQEVTLDIGAADTFVVLASGPLGIAAIGLKDSAHQQKLQVIRYDAQPVGPGVLLPDPPVGDRLFSTVVTANASGFVVVGDDFASPHEITTVPFDAMGTLQGPATNVGIYTASTWYGSGAVRADSRHGITSTYQSSSTFVADIVQLCD
jgi:hypothetical protein